MFQSQTGMKWILAAGTSCAQIMRTRSFLAVASMLSCFWIRSGTTFAAVNDGEGYCHVTAAATWDVTAADGNGATSGRRHIGMRKTYEDALSSNSGQQACLHDFVRARGPGEFPRDRCVSTRDAAARDGDEVTFGRGSIGLRAAFEASGGGQPWDTGARVSSGGASSPDPCSRISELPWLRFWHCGEPCQQAS